MPLSHHIIPSMAGGELSPSLHARVDLAKYHTGLKTARNVNILPQGGVRNRPGTYYVANAGNSSYPVRLFPFVYSDGQAYIIEAGQNYFRFFKNDIPLLYNTALAVEYTPITKNNPGDMIQIGPSSVAIMQGESGGDRKLMFSFPYGATSPVTYFQVVMNSSDALDYDVVTNSGQYYFTLKLANTTRSKNYADVVQTFLRATPLPTVRVSANAEYTAEPPISNASWSDTAFFGMTANPASRYYSCLSETLAWDTHNTQKFPIIDTAYWKAITSSTVVSVVSPYTGAQLSAVKIVQSADVLYLVHPLFCPKMITRYSDSKWVVSDFPFKNGPFMLQNQTTDVMHASATTGSVTLSIGYPPVTPGFNALSVGSLFKLTETIVAGNVSETLTSTVPSTAMQCGSTWRIITSGGWTGTLGIYVCTDGVNYNLIRNLVSTGSDNYDTSGDTGASQCLVRAVVTTSAGTCTINLYHDTFDWYGILRITAVTNYYTATATVLTEPGVGVGLASTGDTTQWEEGSWSDYRGWPTVATFYQDRLVAASTISEPQTRWFSQTADYVNFGISAPLVDSDSISDLLPSRTVNIVKNMIALTGLVTLTSDSDFSTEPGNSGVLAPNSISTMCQGHRGSSDITPAVVGNELIIALPMGSSIRNLIYQFSVQGYMGDNISVAAQHLFVGYKIIEMAYQQEPDSLVWAVRNDGVLLCLTYLREQEVIAWTHHDTDGLFESVAVIPNTTLGINEVWFVVNRGGTRFIERLAKRDMGTDVKNYVMLDCAITTTSSGTTVSGLTHLNGKVVNVLADGDVVEGLTVANNAITLPRAATIVHVGLPYVSDVETLRIEQADQKGTSQGRRVVVPEVTIRFMDSRGGYFKAMSQDIAAPASTGVVGFDEVLEREAGDLASVALPLRTRDYKVSMNGGYDFGAALWFRQTQPLPITILAFVPKCESTDN